MEDSFWFVSLPFPLPLLCGFVAFAFAFCLWESRTGAATGSRRLAMTGSSFRKLGSLFDGEGVEAGSGKRKGREKKKKKKKK